MKNLTLFFVCFMMCGCRTLTATQLDSLQQHFFYAGVDVGYKEGYKLGFKVGEIFGHIDEIKYQSDRLMKDVK